MVSFEIVDSHATAWSLVMNDFGQTGWDILKYVVFMLFQSLSREEILVDWYRNTKTKVCFLGMYML